MMPSAPTQSNRHRRSKSYPPRDPPSSGITFTLADHFTSCFTFCFACFPSFSRRSLEESSSSDELDFPRDTLDSLLPAFSSEHSNNQDDTDDDAAAWGSDALSLRSQFGASNRSSRERNPKGLFRSWLGRLIAGRGKHPNLEEEEESDDERDFLEDPVIGWQVDDQAKLLDDDEVDWEDNADRRSRTIDTSSERMLVDSAQSHLAEQREDGKGEDDWGAFSSAPVTRQSPNLTTPTSPSASLSAEAYPFSTSTNTTRSTEPINLEPKSSSISDPMTSTSSPSLSITPPLLLKDQSSTLSEPSKREESLSPSDEDEPMSAEN